MTEDSYPDGDQLIAGAAQFLIEGNEREAAALLLSCDVDSMDRTWDNWDGGSWYLTIGLRGPRVLYDAFEESENATANSVRNAVRAALPNRHQFGGVVVRASSVQTEAGWRDALLEAARGKTVHNQAVTRPDEHVIVWNQLRYRSKSEVRIADALDQVGVFFLPNCKGRLTGDDGKRVNRDPDFLICYNGHWGILEVDGEPFHPASRTVQDHQRDRLFRKYGVKTVEHFDATECYQQPHEVVKKFLAILARQHET